MLPQQRPPGALGWRCHRPAMSQSCDVEAQAGARLLRWLSAVDGASQLQVEVAAQRLVEETVVPQRLQSVIAPWLVTCVGRQSA